MKSSRRYDEVSHVADALRRAYGEGDEVISGVDMKSIRVATDIVDYLDAHPSRPAVAVGIPGAAPTRDALVAAFEAADELLYVPDTATAAGHWTAPARAEAERMADVALAALRGGGADPGGEDEVRAWAHSHGVGDAGDEHRSLIDTVEKVRLLARLKGVQYGQETARADGQDYTAPDGTRWVRVEADPETGEPLTTEHFRHLFSATDFSLTSGLARLAAAAGVPPGSDVDTVEAAIRAGREPEVVTGDVAAQLPVGSIFIACDSLGLPLSGFVSITKGRYEFTPPVELSALTDYRVLYRAPAPTPAPLTVGEIVTGDRAVSAPVGTKLGAKAAAVAAVHTTGGWSVTGLKEWCDHEAHVRLNEWVVLALPEAAS